MSTAPHDLIHRARAERTIEQTLRTGHLAEPMRQLACLLRLGPLCAVKQLLDVEHHPLTVHALTEHLYATLIEAADTAERIARRDDQAHRRATRNKEQ